MHTDEEMILSDYVGECRAEDEYGSVQELGYFARVEVGGPAEQARVIGYDAPEEGVNWLEPGWYIYKEDDQGNIFVIPCDDEQDSLTKWEEVEGMYDEWYHEVKGFGAEDIEAAMAEW